MIFVASTAGGTPARITVYTGSMQMGAVNQPLPRPLVAVVTDGEANRLSGVEVTFTVSAGGGRVGDGIGPGAFEYAATTDLDGLAVASFAPGAQEGFDNHIVEATILDEEQNPSPPATFVASAQAPMAAADTRVSGIVLDNTDQPVEGVTVSIGDIETVTGEDGQFTLSGVPVGNVLLRIDTSTIDDGQDWPKLAYKMLTVAGRDNTLGMPVYVLPLTTEKLFVGASSGGGTITLEDYPGFSLEVPAGSATFPGGGQEGEVSVTVVHADKTPMLPTFGAQPRFVITIQPPGTKFDPPAKVTFPNVNGLAPGQVTEFLSFDGDLGQYVSIGTGTVSADGTMVVSDPGVGIPEAGWHGDCGDCAGPTGELQGSLCPPGGAVPPPGSTALPPLCLASPLPPAVLIVPNPVFAGVGQTVVVRAVGAAPGAVWSLSPSSAAAITSVSPDGTTVTVKGLSPGSTTLTVEYLTSRDDASVQVFGLELTDTKDPTTVSDDEVVAPNGVAWIEAHKSPVDDSPRMPQLEARLVPTPPSDVTMSCSFETSYTRPNGLSTDIVRIPSGGGSVVLPGSQPWLIHDSYDSLPFFGGSALVLCKLDEAITTLQFSILGKNPDDGRAKNRIDALAGDQVGGNHLPYAYAIARHETKDFDVSGSRYNQFSEVTGLPVWGNDGLGEPGGFGLFQITQPAIPREQIWNWHANVVRGAEILDEKRAEAAEFIAEQRADALGDTGMIVPVPLHTVPRAPREPGVLLGDAIDGPAPSPAWTIDDGNVIDAVTVKAFNGAEANLNFLGTGHYCVWKNNGPAPPFRWEYPRWTIQDEDLVMFSYVDAIAREM